MPHQSASIRRSILGVSVVIVLASSLITARPARTAPKKPKHPTPTATPAPATPTPPPTPIPTPTHTPPPPPEGLAVSVHSPEEGAASPWSTIDVHGIARSPGALGVIVDGVTAMVGPETDGERPFFVDDLALTSGENVVTASALTMEGSEVSETRSVTGGPTRSPIRLRAQPVAGTAPLTVTFEIRIDPGASFKPPEVDFDGDGIPDATFSSPSEVTRIFAEPGLHRVRLVSQSAGRPIVDEVAILVEDPSDLVSSLQALWEEFRTALRVRDLDRALALVAFSARERAAAQLGGMIDLGLDPDLVFHAVEPATIYPGMAEFSMPRTEPNGDIVGYPVHFTRDTDGIWRIKGF